MKVALIGATGLVGSHLLPRLAAHDVLVLSRRSTGMTGIREKIAPAEDWPRLLQGEQVDAAVSTLGTTWAQAKSWRAYEAVDRTAVAEFARAAKAAGARQMIVVSAVGADRRSPNGYLSLKGRVERDLRTIGFDHLDILRPGLLRGQRGTNRRLGERIGIAVSPLINLLLRGRLERFAAIDAGQVAAAIATLLDEGGSGVHIHHNREIRSLAGK